VNAKLIFVDGPLKDTTFAIPNGEVSVGRDPSNLLAISDPALSRRHCVLVRENGSYRVQDLTSRNGTFVNGAAVKEAALKHGDQVSVGDSVFVLLLNPDDDILQVPRVDFEDEHLQPTAQLAAKDLLYLHPDRLLRELPAASRVARNLNALLRISQSVYSIRSLEELQSQILSCVFEIVPAEQGAILLDIREDKSFSGVFARNRSGSGAESVRISRTISRQVLEKRIAVLASNVETCQDLAGVESVIDAQVRSILCVPLIAFDKTLGCLYLDASDPTHTFNEEHLQMVAAIASISAAALENARRLHWLEQENIRLITEINLEHNLVGESPRMKEVFQFLLKVAPTDSTVLIQGESGTGKELAARAIHRNSARSTMAFAAINCAAIPDTLLESELFGHERGAFTGAASQKKGRLEAANGGTVFLDEIGELVPGLQAKLLRVLQEREFERVGGIRSLPLDIRLVAASNKNLEEAVRMGEFRADLFYRLNVLSVIMPPLRERREDIPLLTECLVSRYVKKFNARPRKIAKEALSCLINHDWPGNVRELENAIERALVLGAADEIRPEDLPEAILEKSKNNSGGYHGKVIETKRQLILSAVETTKGNYLEAATLLGIHVNYLHRLIRNLELREAIRLLRGESGS
jgi:Nif-specific regulatory protein